MAEAQHQQTGASDPVPLRVAFRTWLHIGLASFGGPAGQIALMHRMLVEERRWIGEARFLHALNYCMLLPGPEAQQLATYVGWLMNRTVGGLVAGTLFVIPGALVILGLSALYVGYRDLSLVAAIFFGVKAAVLAVIIEAVHRIGKRALRNGAMIALAAAAFFAIFFFAAPFPVIVLAALILGYAGGRLGLPGFDPAAGHAAKGRVQEGLIDRAISAGGLRHTRPSTTRALAILVVFAVLWAAPIAGLAILLGREHVLVEAAIFFSKMAVVTFGGAYAVLAYVAQEAVANYGWLAPGEMLDGLGLAETTPGPLILVLEFVGFLAAFRNPGGLDPWLAGVAGAAVTIWVTFVPCFLWIFLGAPYIERLREHRALASALAAVTAAVVGVVLNLAVWFALHVLFARVDETWVGSLRLYVPTWSSIDFAILAIAAASVFALLWTRLGVLRTLGIAAALGVAWRYAV
jgi:chromate transporter